MDELQQAFGFTDDDLAANQAGHTSPAQRRRLFWRYTFNVWGGWLVVNSFLLLMTVGEGKNLALLLTLLSLGVFAFNTYHLYLSHSKIDAHCGAILFENVAIRGSMIYKLYVDQKEIAYLTYEQYRLLRSGQPYCVYTLPFGRQILSLSPSQITPNAQSPELEAGLAIALNFTHDDLRQNQAGILTSSQAKELLSRAATEAALWTIIWSSLLMLSLFSLRLPSLETPAQLPVIALLLLLLVIIGFIELGYHAINASKDREAKKVRQLCGVVSKDFRFNTYYLTINDQRFKVSGKVANLLYHNTPYCIYYAPLTKVIVAIEKVPD